MGFWLPQNLQKRLLLRVLQKISIFSTLDLSNLDVSLGSNSKFSFSNINLYVSELHVPHFDVKEGSLDQLDLNLNVSGGLDINGKGIHFLIVIKQEEVKYDDITFSLTKSIQNLTESILEFSDTEKEIDTQVCNSSEVSIKSDFGEIPGTFNKILDDEPNLDLQQATRLQTMRNKVLNLILNKLTVILKDITIKIEDSLGNCRYEISLNKISLLSREDNLRQVFLKGLSIINNKSEQASYYTSKLSSTSIYMSAIGSLTELYAKELTKVKLLTLDCVQLSFQGLSNIDNLSMNNITIDIDNIHAFLPNIIHLNDSCFIHIVGIIKRFLETCTTKNNTDISTIPSTISDYTKTALLSYICIKNLYVQLFDDITIIFEQLYLNQINNGDIKLNIDNIKSTYPEFQIKIEKKPIFRGTINSSSTIFKLNSRLDMQLNRKLLISLTNVFKEASIFMDFISRDIPPPSNNRIDKYNNSHIPKNKDISIIGEGILLNIEEQGCVFSLFLDPFTFDNKEFLINSKKLSILLSTACITEEIINIKDISIQLHNKKQKIATFNERLQEIYTLTTLVIQIDSITIHICKDQIKILFDHFVPILHELFQNNKSEEYTSEPSSMRKNKGIFSPSVNKKRHDLMSKQVVIINAIKYKIRDILKDSSFGVVKGELGNNLLIFPCNENEVIITSSFIEMKRILIESEQCEHIFKSISYSKSNKPSLYIHINAHKEDTRYGIKLNNIEMTYRAKWLNILKEMERAKEKKTDPQGSKSPLNCFFPYIDLSIIDSSILLHPYRLNTCLLITFDYQSNHMEPFDTLHINSLIKNANILLIDNFKEMTKPDSIKIRNLTNFYTSQGFCLIGKAKNASVQTTNINNTINMKVNIERLSLILCADSLNSLIQTCIDLKYPDTFPDEKKYRIYFNDDINVLDNVDMDFFIKERNNAIKTRIPLPFPGQNTLNIIDSFLDETPLPLKFPHIPLDNEKKQTTDSQGLTFNDSKIDAINISSKYIDTQKITKKMIENSAFESDNPLSISITLHVGNGVIKLFDGYDWAYSRRRIYEEILRLNTKQSKNERKINRDALNNTEKETNLFNSIYITTNPDVEIQKAVTETIQGPLLGNSVSSNQINLHPSKHYKMLINFEEANININHFNPVCINSVEENCSFNTLNSVDVAIQSFDITDNLETSTWNKFASLLRHEHVSVNDSMFHFHLDMIRPLKYLEAIEYRIKVKFSPLRLHIDQNTLDFAIRFLGFQDSRFDLVDDYPDNFFIQRFEIDPIKLLLDYKPKKIDYVALKSGYFKELMNFFTINGSTIVLQKAILYGLDGFNSLGKELQDIWKPDILKKQISGVLGGISPIKTFISLGLGVKTLVTVLTSHYNQDTVNNISNNTSQWNPKIYLKTSTGRLVHLSANLATGTQNLLEATEAMFGGPGSTTRMTHDKTGQNILDISKLLTEDQIIGKDNPKIKGKVPSALVIDTTNVQNGKVEPHVVSLYADQPLNIQEGLEEAYHSLEKHLHIVYDMVWKRKNKYMESKNNNSPSAAAVSVAKIAPIAIIRPLIGTTEAISKTLQGFANQLDDDNINKVREKYKSRN